MILIKDRHRGLLHYRLFPKNRIGPPQLKDFQTKFIHCDRIEVVVQVRLAHEPFYQFKE
jgi:hypothetical protein